MKEEFRSLIVNYVIASDNKILYIYRTLLYIILSYLITHHIISFLYLLYHDLLCIYCVILYIILSYIFLCISYAQLYV